MTPIETRIKEVYERKLGRELGMAEVDEITLWYRQFAAMLLRWSTDEGVRHRLLGKCAASGETDFGV